MLAALTVFAVLAGGSRPISFETHRVPVGGRTITALVVRAKLADVRIKVGLGQGLMARVEDLGGIAKRYAAVAAINGCFFEAYTSNRVKNIGHLLVTNGRCEHKANCGPALGVTADGEVRIESAKWTIDGARNGNWKWPDRWYAVWINRRPTTASTAIVYTPAWGAETGVAGLQIVVDGGKVTWISDRSATIPRRGYVILFTGSEEKMGRQFAPGQEVEYRVDRTDGGSMEFWGRVVEALGCGPTLLRNGRRAVDPEAEGFVDPKITRQSCVRSAVGLTPRGEILLVAASGTISQLADVMMALGCSDAMNLDGGASSGLWMNGRYIRRPGRSVANALLLLPR